MEMQPEFADFRQKNRGIFIRKQIVTVPGHKKNDLF